MVSVPALVGAPMVLTVLFFAKMIGKLIGVFPAVKLFRYGRQETVYGQPRPQTAASGAEPR